MMLPFLSKPLDIYKKSYLLGLDEFQKEGLNLIYDKSELEKNFQNFIFKLEELETKPKYNLGKVCESVYWLIDNDEYIGRISIRHTLNSYLEKYDGNIGFEIRPSKRKMGYGKIILALGLEQAKILGLKEVLVTCKDSNKASINIIKENNMLLIDSYKVLIEGKLTQIRKYKIVL